MNFKATDGDGITQTQSLSNQVSARSRGVFPWGLGMPEPAPQIPDRPRLIRRPSTTISASAWESTEVETPDTQWDSESEALLVG